MKKLLLTLSAITLLLAMLFSFTSCGTVAPELDIDAAEEAFEDEDYEGIIVVGKKERATLADKGVYGVEDGLLAQKDDSINLEFIGGVEDFLGLDYCVLTFETEEQAATYHHYVNSTYYVTIADYTTRIKLVEDMLKNCEDELDNDMIDNMEDFVKEGNDLIEDLKSVKIGKDGTTVWIANEEAIEDSKK